MPSESDLAEFERLRGQGATPGVIPTLRLPVVPDKIKKAFPEMIQYEADCTRTLEEFRQKLNVLLFGTSGV